VTSKRSFSAKELSRQLDIHYETAWTWCHKLRTCVAALFGKDKLTGVVELDETYLGGKDIAAHKGRSTQGNKAVVAGAVEIRKGHLGRVRLELQDGAEASDLEDFAVRNIEQHAIARTDGFASYGGLVKAGIGHQRVIVGRDPKQASKLFPGIHRVFALLDRVLLGTFHGSVSDKHLQKYLDDFEFRFNRRNSGSRWLLFHRVLEAAPIGPPPTMRRLTQPLALYPT
jgi:transposase-like protein